MDFLSVGVGAVSIGTRIISKIPASSSAWTISSAILSVGTTGGTTAPQLVDMGTGGTAVDHILADGGTIAGLAAFQALTMGTNPIIEAGHYLGVKEANVGALPTVAIMCIAYEEGK